MIQAHQARIIAGTQEKVKAQLDDFIATFEVDEVLVAPLIPGIEQRCKTLKLRGIICSILNRKRKDER